MLVYQRVPSPNKTGLTAQVHKRVLEGVSAWFGDPSSVLVWPKGNSKRGERLPSKQWLSLIYIYDYMYIYMYNIYIYWSYIYTDIRRYKYIQIFDDIWIFVHMVGNKIQDSSLIISGWMLTDGYDGCKSLHLDSWKHPQWPLFWGALTSQRASVCRLEWRRTNWRHDNSREKSLGMQSTVVFVWEHNHAQCLSKLREHWWVPEVSTIIFGI